MEEREMELEGGAWTPQRLKLTLTRHLHGEKVVILANREPYIHERQNDGSIKVQHPASGLVTALEPVMHACSVYGLPTEAALRTMMLRTGMDIFVCRPMKSLITSDGSGFRRTKRRAITTDLRMRACGPSAFGPCTSDVSD
jgi:trehalose-6-phosphate synthase